MTVAVVYDPRNLTWDHWASLMVEAYGSQQLAIPTSESEWRDWATGFCGIGLFESDAAPSPYAFEKWQDWASAVVGAITLLRG